MKEKEVINYLEETPFQVWDEISFKVIPKDKVIYFEFQRESMPVINSEDPMIKDLSLQVHDVVAVLRDYELEVSPYYFYRIVK